MDKAYDDHSISSARSSSTNGDRDSAPTSNSFHIYDDKSDLASSVGTRSNSEYTNREIDSDALSPTTSVSTKSHISNDNFINTAGSEVFSTEKDAESLLYGGDTTTSAFFHDKLSSHTGTFQSGQDLLKKHNQNSNILSAKRQIYGKENNFENLCRKYSDHSSKVVMEAIKRRRRRNGRNIAPKTKYQAVAQNFMAEVWVFVEMNLMFQPYLGVVVQSSY